MNKLVTVTEDTLVSRAALAAYAASGREAELTAAYMRDAGFVVGMTLNGVPVPVEQFFDRLESACEEKVKEARAGTANVAIAMTNRVDTLRDALRLVCSLYETSAQPSDWKERARDMRNVARKWLEADDSY